MHKVTRGAQIYGICRQRHEEAVRYGSEAAAKQLQRPTAEDFAAAAPVQDGGNSKAVMLSTGSPDAVRDKFAKSSSAGHQKHSSSGQDAAKQQAGAQMHARPQQVECKQGAAGSSRDHSMIDVASDSDSADDEQTETASATAPSMGTVLVRVTNLQS